jgi:hypothetical protein
MGIPARRWINRCSFIDTLDNNKALLASFHDGNKTWLLLSVRYEGGSVLSFWEEMIYEHSSKGVSLDFIFKVIEYITTLCQGKRGIDIVDSVKYSPHGWRYWGSGVPKPVSDYYDYEFDEDLEKFIEEHNIQNQGA